jgi:phosphoglycerate kinase
VLYYFYHFHRHWQVVTSRGEFTFRLNDEVTDPDVKIVKQYLREITRKAGTSHKEGKALDANHLFLQTAPSMPLVNKFVNVYAINSYEGNEKSVKIFMDGQRVIDYPHSLKSFIRVLQGVTHKKEKKMKKTIKDVNVQDKTVLVRVDFNVPLDKKTLEITDDNRIRAALPTIQYLIEHGAKVVLLSHLGRVASEEDKPKNSLSQIAERLEQLLGLPVTFIASPRGSELEEGVKNLQPGQVILVENTRYLDVVDGKEVKLESKCNDELSQYWASLGDIFVIDAFGSAHRAAASVSGIAKYISGGTVSGFLIEKEIKYLFEAVHNPKRPLIAILGGSKVSDKVEVIKNILTVADQVLIGGGMAYTFYKAKGYEVGTSLLEEDKVELAKELLKNPKIVIGLDCVVNTSFADTKGTVREVGQFQANEMGLDIGPKTIALFKSIIKNAGTVVWNGPLGVFEFANYEKGTKEIAKAIGANKKCISIIGGGDSASAVAKFGLESLFTHISTGGGASLEYLEGKKLPGVEAIDDLD